MNYACDFLNLWEGDMLSPYGRWNLRLFPSTLLLLSIDALSIALIGLCIDELEQIIHKFVKHEGIEEDITINVITMFFISIKMILYFFYSK